MNLSKRGRSDLFLITPALLYSVLALWVWSTAALSQSLSLTFDDGLDPTKQQSAKVWNDQIISGLKDTKVSAMVFPSLSRIGGEEGMNLIRAWTEAGHSVGNHTSRHRNLSSSEMTLDQFIADVVEADVVLRNIPRFVPMLRFPYLKEGNNVEKRDGIRSWMSANGYVPAAVSIDTSDWYYNQLFVTLTNAGSSKKARQVQRAYIAHLINRAAYYDGLARKILGRSPRHVMLLHISAINAASVVAIVTEFRARGWKFVSPIAAFSDPMYAMRPNIVPAGESIVWALAKERAIDGLRYPGEDSVYEEPILRTMGLLPKSNGG